MKDKKYLQPVAGIFLLLAGLISCNKQTGPGGNFQGKPGHYVFAGSNKSILDSQYVADTATHEIGQLSIDSSFADIVDVIVDKQSISFSIRSGTFTERMLGYLTYRFPVSGPYGYTAHALPGMSYKFTFSGKDSLNFSYYYSIAGGYFLYKKLEFRGKRIQ